jgi:hypothetical protein
MPSTETLFEMPPMETPEQPDSDMFVSALVTEVPDGKSYVFAKFLESGTENGLAFSKSDGAFIWLNGHSRDNIRAGMTINVDGLRESDSWKRPGDKKYTANLAPIEFQPELSAELVEPVQQPEPATYESKASTMTPAIQKVVDSAIQKRKAEMRDLSARLTVTRTFKGTKAKYLNFLSASVGSPSEALEACIEFCYDQNFGF